MALVKVGDEQPILGCYNSEGEKQICPDCGTNLSTLCVDGKAHRLMCKNCDYTERVKYEK